MPLLKTVLHSKALGAKVVPIMVADEVGMHEAVKQKCSKLKKQEGIESNNAALMRNAAAAVIKMPECAQKW